MVYPPQAVTHPSTNLAQCRLTALIEANALTTTLCCLCVCQLLPWLCKNCEKMVEEEERKAEVGCLLVSSVSVINK